MMGLIRSANLALKFILELAAFAGLAAWGSSLDGLVTRVVCAVAAPAAAIVIWGLFAAPRSPRRLSLRARVPLELGVFVLSAVAMGAAGHQRLAVAFAIAVVVNAAALTLRRQWDA
jgi:hypothetical protein